MMFRHPDQTMLLLHFRRLARRLVRRLALLILLAVGTTVLAQPDIRSEYDLIGYGEPPAHNRVARLIERIESGEVQLEYRGHRGYLESFLQALDIDPHSQLLVFSKTSLQYALIDFAKPRAVYFNDDTYIGWVQHSTIVEITTTDTKLGTVFYTFDNIRDKPRVNLESQRCIVCHDSTGATGGGIPTVMARSSIYTIKDFSLADGDKLDLRDLLQNENTGNLQNYLEFDTSTANTLIKVSPTGAFLFGIATNAAETERIVLENVNLRTGLGLSNQASDQEVINKLLTQGKLLVDQV